MEIFGQGKHRWEEQWKRDSKITNIDMEVGTCDIRIWGIRSNALKRKSDAGNVRNNIMTSSNTTTSNMKKNISWTDIGTWTELY